jgi:hypothetical protein
MVPKFFRCQRNGNFTVASTTECVREKHHHRTALAGTMLRHTAVPSFVLGYDPQARIYLPDGPLSLV